MQLHHQAGPLDRAAEPRHLKAERPMPAWRSGALGRGRLVHRLPDQRAVGEDVQRSFGSIPQERVEVLVVVRFTEMVEPGHRSGVRDLARRDTNKLVGQAAHLAHADLPVCVSVPTNTRSINHLPVRQPLSRSGLRMADDRRACPPPCAADTRRRARPRVAARFRRARASWRCRGVPRPACHRRRSPRGW